jgi:hypothetical protein
LPDRSSSIDADAAVTAVKLLTGRFEIESLMTFGGEPLLFDETVCKIHSAARDCGIQNRQLITNGFFSKDERIIDEIAKNICDAGVNYVMLSVDAFHQETIPIDPVMKFAEALTAHGISKLRVHPAWVVNKENEDTYNAETKRLLKLFIDKGIPASNGNNIFLSGNALKHLAEYYPLLGEIDLSLPCGSAPYSSRPDNVDCICINPDGAVNACTELGNIYSNCILDIVDNYDPYKNPALKEVLDGGVPGLLRYVKSLGIEIDISDCRSACSACRKAIKGAIQAEDAFLSSYGK